MAKDSNLKSETTSVILPVFYFVREGTEEMEWDVTEETTSL